MTWFRESQEDGRDSAPLHRRVLTVSPAIAEAARGRLTMVEAVDFAISGDQYDSYPCEEGNAVVLEDLDTGEIVVVRLAGSGVMVENAIAAGDFQSYSRKMLRTAEAARGKKVVRERRYRAGYVIRDEYWQGPDGKEMLMERQAYTPNGDWIGDSVWAHRLTVLHGIIPEKADASHSVCSIGYCPQKRRWYGWSHRAMCGFGIGDKVFEPDWPQATDKTPFRRHGDKVIESLEEAKEAAKNFARYVS